MKRRDSQIKIKYWKRKNVTKKEKEKKEKERSKEKEKKEKERKPDNTRANNDIQKIINWFSVPWKNDLEFQELIQDFISIRKKMKHPLNEEAVKRLDKKFNKWGHERTIIALSFSIEMDYRGIYEPKNYFQSSIGSRNVIQNEIKYPNGIEIKDSTKIK
jgi:hypothetical protein